MGAKQLGLLALVVVGCLAIGFATSRRATSASPVPAPAAVTPRAPAIAAPTTSPKQTGSGQRRFPRPPPPTHDPGLVAWLEGGVEVPKDALESRLKDIDRRLDELFGADFPAEKRKGVLAAQEQWTRAHAHAVFAFYNGEISQDELTEAVHQNMIGWAQGTAAALSADEYRRYADLPPGVDPWTVLATPGQKAGDILDDSDPARAKPTP